MHFYSVDNTDEPKLYEASAVSGFHFAVHDKVRYLSTEAILPHYSYAIVDYNRSSDFWFADTPLRGVHQLTIQDIPIDSFFVDAHAVGGVAEQQLGVI